MIDWPLTKATGMLCRLVDKIEVDANASFSHILYADDPASCTRVGGCYCESAKERRRCFYWPTLTDE